MKFFGPPRHDRVLLRRNTLYLEHKAESGVRGENAVQKRLSEAEAEMQTLNRKLNWLFKENAQLRKENLRLRQKST